MNQVIRVADAREVLALVPFQLGYTPRESVVFVALRGERQRLGVMARADGRDLVQPSGKSLLGSIMDFLARDGATKAIAIVYADCDDGSVAPWLNEAVDRIERLAVRRMPVTAWWVNGTDLRIGRHDLEAAQAVSEKSANAPESALGASGLSWDEPLPIGDLSTTQVSATMVVHGHVVAGNRAELARLPRMSPELEHRLWRAGDRYRRLFKPPLDAADSAQGRQWLARSGELWDAALDASAARSFNGITGRPELPPLTWARLGVALNHKGVRDRVLARIVGMSLEGGSDADSAPSSGTGDGADFSELFAPTGSTVPDTALLQGLSEAVAYATAATRHKHRSDGHAVLALLAWWEGSGAKAAEHCDTALRIDRKHRLAVLVRHMLDIGLPPGWVANRDSRFSEAMRE
ncbi:DUF4192 domain-containing protein [Rarobacter faecitabidus]|uniref:Uncharacterized protein DUF4192 n=1 Tax=Rarobacter faecitabidus TaxID=13243 RepID=A0A542ZVF5_RARFA|nr:DUF4192 domain-containing protein [Rarobacter faecitabidus]TQL64344.1 uncharacterized protein DUF4192 [Rarobacter faecitabidus]